MSQSTDATPHGVLIFQIKIKEVPYWMNLPSKTENSLEITRAAEINDWLMD